MNKTNEMSLVVQTPQASCRGAMVCKDITPPIGIYHRMWGAALHDRATGIHRPLEARLLWLEPRDSELNHSDPKFSDPKFSLTSTARILLSLDHCILDSQEIENIRESIHQSTDIPKQNILVTLTHTHGAGWMSRSRSSLPGGELLGPYLDDLAVQMGQLALEAKKHIQPLSIVYGKGRCELAAHRDYFDIERQKFVCGFNPLGKADDTLLIARITNATGTIIGNIINYACHPTTLAWDNTLISPDWVGAMRETIDKEVGGLSLFLQGASGDLGPREGFVGDTAIADRNGKQVGYSVLSTLSTLPQPNTEYRYAGPVISGTAIGTWQHSSLPPERATNHNRWHWESIVIELPYRIDLPSIEQTLAERDHWLNEEQKARQNQDELRVRDCRAQVEQRTRQLTRLNHLVPGKSYPLTMHIGVVGAAIWIFVPGELYQIFQTTLRQRFAPYPVFITTLTNDWQPGYIPPASSYGYEIYQEVIAATAPGCLESMIESISRRLTGLIAQQG
jgi:hypothetical protein